LVKIKDFDNIKMQGTTMKTKSVVVHLALSNKLQKTLLCKSKLF
jgi:hypothetical protein